jgi:hypothetical protein
MLTAVAPPPALQAVARTGGRGKFGIESPTQGVIAGTANLNFGGSVTPVGGGGFGGFGWQFGGVSNGQLGGAGQASLTTRQNLVLDAQANERIRRKAIHERLSRAGAVRPYEIEPWLYKEVLHVDLDDPMLGVDKVLTENYPFAEEDRILQQRQDARR